MSLRNYICAHCKLQVAPLETVYQLGWAGDDEFICPSCGGITLVKLIKYFEEEE